MGKDYTRGMLNKIRHIQENCKNEKTILTEENREKQNNAIAIIPKNDILIANLKSIFLCFKFVNIVAIAVGIKNTKLVACAICCSKFINTDKRIINTVPPPIPNPVTIPEIIP